MNLMCNQLAFENRSKIRNDLPCIPIMKEFKPHQTAYDDTKMNLQDTSYPLKFNRIE